MLVLLAGCAEPTGPSLAEGVVDATDDALETSEGAEGGPHQDALDAGERPSGVREVQERARNPECDPSSTSGEGAGVPWEGFRVEGDDYTCNTCQGGLEALQGTWRLIDFATEDPDVPLEDGWGQSFVFDTNTWRQVARWQEGTVEVEATLSGWYWCGSKPELNNEAKVFVVTALSPPDAFGYAQGDVFTADLLNSTEDGDKLAFWFYAGFNRGEQLAEIYCRVGASVTTLAGEVKPCLTPFPAR